ncbi:MAG: HEPN domain-containing protein [Candidatus Aenigmatarchaeota archaeon]
MKEETKQWLEKANKDLNRAKILINFDDYEDCLFHLQQAIEKYFKAYLIDNDAFKENLHKTHNLKFLLKECSKIDKDFENLLDKNSIKLLSLGIIVRYPFPIEIKKEDIEELIEIAEKVKNFVSNKLKEKLE